MHYFIFLSRSLVFYKSCTQIFQITGAAAAKYFLRRRMNLSMNPSRHCKLYKFTFSNSISFCPMERRYFKFSYCSFILLIVAVLCSCSKAITYDHEEEEVIMTDGTMFKHLPRMSSDQISAHAESLKEFLSHSSFHGPSHVTFHNGRKVLHQDSVHHDSHGRRFEIKYSLQPSMDHIFFSLEELQKNYSLANVITYSNATIIELKFNDTTMAKLVRNSFLSVIINNKKKCMLTGRSNWGISREILGVNRSHTLLAEIDKVFSHFEGQDGFKIKISHCSLEKAFENAEISLELKAHDLDGYMIKPTDNMKDTISNQEDNRDERELDAVTDFFSDLASATESFISMTAQAISNLINIVNKAVQYAVSKIESLASGDLTVSTKDIGSLIPMASFNYNPDMSGCSSGSFDLFTELGMDSSFQSNVDLKCTSCYVYGAPKITIGISIKAFQLYSVTLVVGGEMNFKMEMSGKFNKQLNQQWEKTIMTFTSGPYVVMLGGIPFTFSTITPFQMGLDVAVSLAYPVVSSIYMSVKIKAGFSYNGRMQMIHDAQASFGGNGIDFTSLCNGVTAMASATMYILPVANLVVDFIGGPNIGLKGYITTNALLAPSYNPPQAVLNIVAGYEGSIGAKLDITINVGGHKYTVYQSQMFGPYVIAKFEHAIYTSNSWNPRCTYSQSRLLRNDDDTHPVTSLNLEPLMQPALPNSSTESEYIESAPTGTGINTNTCSNPSRPDPRNHWEILGSTWFGNQTLTGAEANIDRACANLPKFMRLTAKLIHVAYCNAPDTFYLLLTAYIGIDDFAAGKAFSALSTDVYYVEWFANGNSLLRSCSKDSRILSSCNEDIPYWRNLLYGQTTSTSLQSFAYIGTISTDGTILITDFNGCFSLSMTYAAVNPKNRFMNRKRKLQFTNRRQFQSQSCNAIANGPSPIVNPTTLPTGKFKRYLFKYCNFII